MYVCEAVASREMFSIQPVCARAQHIVHPRARTHARTHACQRRKNIFMCMYIFPQRARFAVAAAANTRIYFVAAARTVEEVEAAIASARALAVHDLYSLEA